MNTLSITPLEAWVAGKIGLGPEARPNPERLAAYQLELLNQTLIHAVRHVPFYQKMWANRPVTQLNHLDELQKLPFTTADSLREAPLQHLGISQAEVARVVTLYTSGTTGTPKRIFFSDRDMAHTVDFFHHGLAAMMRPEERLLILLPGDLPDSAANLLQQAAARMNVEAIVHGLVLDPGATIQAMLDYKVHSLAGIPVQLLSLARHPDAARIPANMLKSVLLSTDYVPEGIVQVIREQWGCAVFQHYGMTEMGYGGAMSCAAHDGYHLREADLLFEIIDPVTTRRLPPGRKGEIVFTTLNHQAMPLIRYRTGDLAAMLMEPCPCGSVLRRMAWVKGRHRENIRLAGGFELNLADLDEALFRLPNVINFQVVFKNSGRREELQLTLFGHQADALTPLVAEKALTKVSAIQNAVAEGTLTVTPIRIEQGPGASGPVVKRKITDCRSPGRC